MLFQIQIVHCYYTLKYNYLLHKYMIHINHLFKIHYLSLHTFLHTHTISCCHIIIPSAYERVSKECKCSGN